jgi:hypothetical protein
VDKDDRRLVFVELGGHVGSSRPSCVLGPSLVHTLAGRKLVDKPAGSPVQPSVECGRGRSTALPRSPERGRCCSCLRLSHISAARLGGAFRRD